MSTPRNPAPGELVAVQTLLNSPHRHPHVPAHRPAEPHPDDVLSEPEAATRWLREQGLLGGDEAVDAAGLERLVAVRGGLLALTVANNGGAPDPAALEGLHRAADELRLRSVIDAGGLRLEPAGRGVERLITRLVAAVHRAQEDGTWCRLKACRDETCRLVFWDSSKNVCGSWCEMGACGNRAKARRYRSRRRVSGAEPPSR